jgi:glycosyltransferase involved in cell wall biosynthesis
VRLALLTRRLARAAADVGPAEIVHANDVDTLPAGRLLARRWNARLVYDAHELYGDKEARPPALYRFVIRRLERMLARRADAVVTVSDAIADELAAGLDGTRPTVVLNCADAATPPPRAPRAGPLRAVYQASFGLARFPEDVLDAIEQTSGVESALRIAGIDRDDLERQIQERGLAGRVSALPPVAPDQLVSALEDFDVGLVIDRPLMRNGFVALPNKLFEYLAAGLAVVVPGLPAMKALVEERKVGLVYPAGDASGLAHALQRLADDRELLATLQQNARAAVAHDLNAEFQMRKVAAIWDDLDRQTNRRRNT